MKIEPMRNAQMLQCPGSERTFTPKSAPTWILSLERGRVPLALSLISAATLAIFTIFRFVMMVRILTPEQYGYLNLLTTISNLLPMIAILGIPLHLQKIVRSSGTGYIAFGIRKGLVASSITILPTVCALIVLVSPFSQSRGELLISAVAVSATCHGIGCVIYSSQLLLAAGYRSLASLSMLMVNSTLTWTMLIPYMFDWSSVEAILVCWSIGCLLTALIVVSSALWLAGKQGPDSVVNAVPRIYGYPRKLFISGIKTIPSLVGPWALVFAIRYLMGIYLGESALAQFSISSTVVESSFTIAVAVISISANRILDGTSRPLAPFLWSTGCLLLVCTPAIFLLPAVLDTLSSDGYSFSIAVSAILLVGAVARLYLLSWRQRALAVGTLGALSMQFVSVTVLSAILIVICRPDHITAYALVQTGSYLVVAISQQIVTARREYRLKAATSTGLPSFNDETVVGKGMQ
ncbi:hypothetical protein ACFYSW_29215 [Rhodococcus aetherivorans]|uniref:hypothetical protein n=1 Tax=Rhodococcus aetherivorans TaxID=191292 RepID=UPI00368E3D34